MTASIQNTNSAIAILERTIDEFQKYPDAPTVLTKGFHLATLMDSVKKCLASLSAQVRFYNSAKATTRAIAVRREDGGDDYVSGLDLEALRLPLPNLEQDFVIYGKPDALRAVATALAGRGWPSNGPAPLHDLATQLAREAVNDPKEPDRCQAR
ncbi:hypothetical protein [Roseibium alexandrii]|uniref:Uncharacterized protein n=1 Tax=Roseibium alexandrii (strain DSM 17067 / NCIMB 14079 / DFL-11) TaxID=244592 RepID=A0A5E8H0P5_ROSAD|nr:hypothetical protein [Roseibium alexandrii]EEE44861.1 hypothetical protein SADFL11_2149 [Roseibium alexandrii DFL-11]